MPIEIVQLGQWPFRGKSSSKAGQVFDMGVKWRQGTDKLTGVSGIVSHSAPCNPLVDQLRWKIQGSLLCATDTGGCETTWTHFQRMMSLAGGSFQMIGVRGIEECYCRKCGACTTGNSDGRCRDCQELKFAQWMVICVELTSMKRVWEWDSGQQLPYDHIGIEMEVVPITPYWEPLDQIRWRYWQSRKPDFTMTPGNAEFDDPTIYLHPRRIPRPVSTDGGFQYLERRSHDLQGLMLNPENWTLGYKGTQPRPDLGIVTPGLLDAPVSHTFTVPLGAWPAPPRSLYYFSDFNNDGEINIEVTSTLPTLWEVSNQATLDLEVLDANLANDGYEGVKSSDSMIVGDTGLGGGIYLRDGVILDTYIPWEYTGRYPGQTCAGHNIIGVSAAPRPLLGLEEGEDPPGPVGDCYAHLHILRSY